MRHQLLLGVIGVVAAALAVAAPSVAADEPFSSSTRVALAASNISRLDPAVMVPMENATSVKVTGMRTATGCEFQAPELSLGPDKDALIAYQTEIDHSACVTTYVIGTPEYLPPDDPKLEHAEEEAIIGKSARLASKGQAALATSGSGSGNAKAWHTDAVGLTVNSDQSNISWAWNGSCVTASSGSAVWTWLGSTGWEPPTNTLAQIEPECIKSVSRSKSDFKNAGFCWPITVWAHYRAIKAIGRYNGVLKSDFGTVETDNACLPLYEHMLLTRVT